MIGSRKMSDTINYPFYYKREDCPPVDMVGKYFVVESFVMNIERYELKDGLFCGLLRQRPWPRQSTTRKVQ